MRSVCAVASPARTSSTNGSIVKPCAIISASVQPSRQEGSSSGRGEGGEVGAWSSGGCGGLGRQDTMRPETARGRAGMPSSARSESVEAGAICSCGGHARVPGGERQTCKLRRPAATACARRSHTAHGHAAAWHRRTRGALGLESERVAKRVRRYAVTKGKTISPGHKRDTRASAIFIRACRG